MMRHSLALAAFAFFSVFARAGESPPADAPITVTINPEGRVSVAASDKIPPYVKHGVTLALDVDVKNLGFMTGQLEAHVVGIAPSGASVEMEKAALKGIPRERRVLRITLDHSGSIDLTIAFRLHNEAPDIGGRDRIHLLLCGV